MDIEVQQGERLPPEVLDTVQRKMKQLLGNPNDVAKAVLYAVTQPIEVNIADHFRAITKRPARRRLGCAEFASGRPRRARSRGSMPHWG
jgi:hypothetical protein